MSLTEKDLEALRLLMGEEISTHLKPVEQKISTLRNEMQQGFDGLYKRTETLQEEHTVICEQLTRIETNLKSVETKVDGHAERIGALEKKVA